MPLALGLPLVNLAFEALFLFHKREDLNGILAHYLLCFVDNADVFKLFGLQSLKLGPHLDFKCLLLLEILSETQSLLLSPLHLQRQGIALSLEQDLLSLVGFQFVLKT